MDNAATDIYHNGHARGSCFETTLSGATTRCR